MSTVDRIRTQRLTAEPHGEMKEEEEERMELRRSDRLTERERVALVTFKEKKAILISLMPTGEMAILVPCGPTFVDYRLRRELGLLLLALIV